MFVIEQMEREKKTKMRHIERRNRNSYLVECSKQKRENLSGKNFCGSIVVDSSF